MKQKPLEHYMGLNYTVEIVRDSDYYVGQVVELPGCWNMVHESDSVGKLWELLEEAKRKWLSRALREGRWIPEPPETDGEHLKELDPDEDIREALYWSGIRKLPLPLLQKLWLRELGSVGLHHAEAFKATPKTGTPHEPPGKSLAGDVRPVPLGKGGRMAWLRLNGERTDQGYKNIEILDQPIPTDKATIAALTVLEVTEMDEKTLNRVLGQVHKALEHAAQSTETVEKALYRVLDGLLEHWYKDNLLKGFTYPQTRSLSYSLALLRHRRSSFDDLPYQEQVGLFLRHCQYINDALKANRLHTAFLEYGSSKGLSTRTVENAEAQVKAAMLAEVGGLKHHEIAEIMDVPIPRNYKIDMGIPQVKGLVRDGRNLLQKALGKDGWREYAEALKEDAERFESLSTEDRDLEIIAERSGWSVERLRALHESGSAILDLLRFM